MTQIDSMQPGQGTEPETLPDTSPERMDPNSQAAEAPPKEKEKLDMVEMAVTFVSPALFGKLLILYFGSNYSSKPGQGYGIGLVVTIIFTVAMLIRFIWRYKDYAEE